MAPTRRIRSARLALAAVALLAAGTAVAAVGHAHRDETPFGVPRPSAGDRWVYNVSAPGTAGTQVAFELGGPHAVADAAGAWHTAQPLMERRIVPGRDDLVMRHEVAGMATVSSTRETQQGNFATTTVIAPRNLTVADSEVETQWTWGTAYGPAAPCGFASSLQGARLDPADGAQVAGDCAGQDFRALGRTPAGLLVLTNGPVTLWMSDRFPVPVRVERPLPGNATRTLAWTLAGFTAGDAAPSAPAGVPAPLPALVMAAGDRPHDDLPLAFPLDEALRYARASTPIGGFERSHPHSYLRRALADERVDDTNLGRERSVRWDLESTDGQAAVRVRVSRTWTTPAPDDGAEALARTLPTPPQDSFEEVDPSPAPYPSVAPAAWPTVASAIARWHALGGSGENSWGFEAVCGGANCSQAEARTIAGHDDAWRPFQPVGVSVVGIDRRTADLAGFSPGRTAWQERAKVDAAKQYILGPVAVGDAPRDRTVLSSPTTVPPLSFGLATVAGLALLLALLPAKALLALWHRSAREHPVRTQLVQLLEAEPGLHHKEIMRRLARGNAVVSHHLRTLEREGRVVVRVGPRYKVYFLATQDVPAHAALTHSPLAARILEVLDEPATGKQLAERLGVAPSSIAFHVRRFQDAGLVVAHRVGREVVLRRTAA